MPTREEMALALYRAMWGCEPPADVREQVLVKYADIADKVIEWLNSDLIVDGVRFNQEALRTLVRLAKEKAVVQLWFNEFEARVLIVHRYPDEVFPGPPIPDEVFTQIVTNPICPRGHALTHPDDIAKRYCGMCRSYLDEEKR